MQQRLQDFFLFLTKDTEFTCVKREHGYISRRNKFRFLKRLVKYPHLSQDAEAVNSYFEKLHCYGIKYIRSRVVSGDLSFTLLCTLSKLHCTLPREVVPCR